MYGSLSRPSGKTSFKVIRAKGPGLKWHLANRIHWSYLRGWFAFVIAPILAKLFGFATITSRLAVCVHKATGEWINYGWVSYRMLTTAGAVAMANSFITPASPGNFWFHALGTDDTPGESVSDIALQLELTTQYNPDGTRPAGTHVAGGSANIYRTVGTVTVDGGAAVVEHGIFNQAAAGGTLLDRSVFGVVTLATGDSFAATYELTFTAGG